MCHDLRILLLAGTMALVGPALGGAQPRPAVSVAATDGVLTVTPHVAYDYLGLRVATPDGRLFQTEGEGGAVTFRPFAIPDYTAPDGPYVWEVWLTPRGAISPELLARAQAARESGDPGPEQALSLALHRATVVRSGGFLIQDGKLRAGDGGEPRRPGRGPRSGGATRLPFGPTAYEAEDDDIVLADQVIPDDLIVQGSLCVGFDCVNNENFGFDTIRLKENNLRIKFEDTSVGSFPTNDWQLTANDSASGGVSKFSIEDITGAKVPFTVQAGAATNSIYVGSTGRVGFRTSTPVLDLHAATSNTPSIRLEQNSAGGFTAQTWDVAGNEANFFVRDVTGGSRLPLRIRPGAPTSSLDISAAGDIGVGTASPSEKLHVRESVDTVTRLQVENSTNQPNTMGVLRAKSDTGTVDLQAHSSTRNISRFGTSLAGWSELIQMAGNGLAVGTWVATPLILGTSNLGRINILADGKVGIGTSAPAHPLHMGSGAHVTVGGVWTDASSRDSKQDIRALAVDEALAAVQQLSPVRFAYTADPAERHVGFIAEDVPDLVATPDRKSLSPMDVVAVLTRVVQEQQRLITELAAKVQALEAARQP